MHETSTPPLPVQLAKASWLAPVLYVGINAVLGAMGLNEGGSDPDQAVVLTLVAGVLFSAGALCGVAALLCIPRHGTKGILVPALIGTTISGLLLVFMVTSWFDSVAKARQRQRVRLAMESLDSELPEIREQLPIRVDEGTELFQITSEEEEAIYDYRLVDIASDEIDGPILHEDMKPRVVNSLCDQAADYLDLGLTFTYRYWSKDDVLVTEVVVTADDC